MRDQYGHLIDSIVSEAMKSLRETRASYTDEHGFPPHFYSVLLPVVLRRLRAAAAA